MISRKEQDAFDQKAVVNATCDVGSGHPDAAIHINMNAKGSMFCLMAIAAHLLCGIVENKPDSVKRKVVARVLEMAIEGDPSLRKPIGPALVFLDYTEV